MNASPSESPHLNLPPPAAGEQAPKSQSAPEIHSVSVEQAPRQGQRDPTRAQTAATVAPALPLPQAAHAPAAQAWAGSADDAAAAAGAPSGADDTDLIEKEWVDKAKEIVERTRENPYEQSKELNLIKADYMKKRYNKTLKISE